MMGELGIPSLNEFEQKRRIHSLRHTFISEAVANVGNLSLVQMVVGHSRTQSAGTTARYTHVQFEKLLPVVDCISYI